MSLSCSSFEASIHLSIKSGCWVICAIDISARKLEFDLSDEEIEARRAQWVPREPSITTGYLSRYASMVQNAATGAVLKANG